MDPENQIRLVGKSDSTFVATCFNGLNALLGIGILSIPYALSEGGWLSLILFFTVALMCCYTVFLLQNCMMMNPNIKTYPDIGNIAFGRKGKLVVSIFIYLELYLVAIEFLILEGDNLHKLFPNVVLHIGNQTIGGQKVFIIGTTIIVLVTTWVNSLDLLGYISAGGVLTVVILVGFVLWIGTFGGVGFHEKGILWRWNGLPTTMSLYTFCYCAHSVFPTLCSSMRNRSQFPKVILICFVLSTFVYASMAILGYTMYGGNLMSQITLNFPTKNLSSKLATYMILVSPLTKYALIISPISTAIEENIPLHYGKTSSSIVIRTSLVLSTLVVALVIPFFGHVMAFIGSFLNVIVSLILPCLCYLKINKASVGFGKELVLIVIILIFGSLIAVTGTYVSVRDIVRQLLK